MEGGKYVVYVKELNHIYRKRRYVFGELRKDESVILNEILYQIISWYYATGLAVTHSSQIFIMCV